MHRPLASRRYPLFGTVAVVHAEGVNVQRRIAVAHGAKVNGPAIDLHAQHRLIDALGQVKPARCVSVQALPERGTRRHSRQAHGTHEESIIATFAASILLDGLEIILALHQQGQVGLEDGAVGMAAPDRKRRVDQCVDVDLPQRLAHQGHARLTAKVVGELLEYKLCHRRPHLHGEVIVTRK